MSQQIKLAIQELLHENNWETRDSQYSTKQFVVWRKSLDTTCAHLDSGVGTIFVHEDYFTFHSGVACPPKRSYYLYCDPNSLDLLLEDLKNQWHYHLCLSRILEQCKAGDYTSFEG